MFRKFTFEHVRLLLDRTLFSAIATPTEIYTLSLHDALPISLQCESSLDEQERAEHQETPQGLVEERRMERCILREPARAVRDRKSTRLNSSHRTSSYAVFCLKKKRRLKASAIAAAGQLANV